MDPNTQMAEAERWLGIAAKLLAARDFTGSRTFAIRAREADSNNVISDQILAVVDTLLAAEKRINNQYDWYAILQLAHLAREPEIIAAQYRQLVLRLNPDRNSLPFADYALRLVVDAWSVLSDPAKKWLYDSELGLYLDRLDSQNQPVEPATTYPNPVRSDPTGPALANTVQFFQPPPQQEREPPQEKPPQQQSVQFYGNHQPQQESQPNAWVRLRQEYEKQQEEQRLQPPPQQQPPSQPQPQSPSQQQVDEDESQMNQESRANEGTDDTNASPGNGNVNFDVDEETPSFWTVCPYCFYMFEYPETYLDYTLRCQNCRRAFHGAQVPNPPATGDGADSFCCWGYFPVGFSMNKWKNDNQGGNKNGFLNWAPFSPMFTCPVKGNSGSYYYKAAGSKKTVGRKPRGSAPGPRVYIDDEDDDDILDVFSEPSDDSDYSYNMSNRRRKTKKIKRRRGRPKKANALKEKKSNYNLVAEDWGVDGGQGHSLQDRTDKEEPAIPSTDVLGKTDAVKKAGGGSSKKQTGKAAKDRGKLDLNVEFSNEIEEHAPTASAGNGEEEAIEGNGFFEGLDEFLSSLPILNVVGDEKSKPS